MCHRVTDYQYRVSHAVHHRSAVFLYNREPGRFVDTGVTTNRLALCCARATMSLASRSSSAPLFPVGPLLRVVFTADGNVVMRCMTVLQMFCAKFLKSKKC